MPPSHPDEACTDWNDWTKYPELHPAFSYWRVDEQRLGERIYILACLLWTSLHDYCLAKRFSNQFPNWSAICSYYSMVHALRFFWFLSYGSYPTGHAQMAKSLRADERGAAADWRSVQRSCTRIKAEAFECWLSERLANESLSKTLLSVGNAFDQARQLRTDSNYESLILAHQYYHGVSDQNHVNVQKEFQKTTDLMQKSAIATMRFVSDTARRAFDDEICWITLEAPSDGEAPSMGNSSFLSSHTYALLLAYMRDKIKRAERDSAWGAFLSEGLADVEPLNAELMSITEKDVGPAVSLRQYVGYTVFDVKSNLMREFGRKVRRLENAIGDLHKHQETDT